MKFELDIYWIVYGGESPVHYLSEDSARFPLYHVKDRTWRDRGPDVQDWEDTGPGSIDFPDVFEAGAGRWLDKHFIIEHDWPLLSHPGERYAEYITAAVRAEGGTRRQGGPGISISVLDLSRSSHESHSAKSSVQRRGSDPGTERSQAGTAARSSIAMNARDHSGMSGQPRQETMLASTTSGASTNVAPAFAMSPCSGGKAAVRRPCSRP